MSEKQEILVLDSDAAMGLWLQDKLNAKLIDTAEADRLWRAHRERVEKAASNVSNADDAMTVIGQMRDMRTPIGRIVYKRYGGKMHVIIKGTPACA